MRSCRRLPGQHKAWCSLAEQWEGGTWTSQPTPNPPGGTLIRLTSIACPSASRCTAAGFYTASTGTITTRVERRNGRAWTNQPIPSPVGSNAQQESIDCPATRNCTAVGFSATAGTFTALAEHWNGITWAIQNTANPGPGGSYLVAIACPSARSCTAVGSYTPASSGAVTLAER